MIPYAALQHKSKYLLLFALFFTLFFLAPASISKGCGPYDTSFYGYSFLNPKIINLGSKNASYFAGFEELFKQIGAKQNIQEQDNISEWRSRFCDIPKAKDLHQLIYKAPINQIRVLSANLRQKDTPLPVFLANNTFAVHLKKNGCTEAVDYLFFAKKCEPHVIVSDGWKIPIRDTVAMSFLIKDGLKKFRKTKSHYFKLRYAYQLIRLAHYKKNYEEVLDLYDFLLPKIDNEESLIEDWIEGHRAGALTKLERHVEASYLYAKIFDHCPSKRTSAYRSFKILTDDEWIDCLKLCQDNHERATLYALRASHPNSKVVSEIKNIYTLDPENENLELLLVREIRQLEKDLLGLDFNKKKRENRRMHQLPRKIAGQQVIDLQQLVRMIIEEEKIPNINLWKIADGYLELLAGDYYAAKKTLKSVQDSVHNEVLQDQLEAMLMAATIDGFEEVDEDMEQVVVQFKKNPIFRKYPDFDKFTKDKLSYLYKSKGLSGKAFLNEYSVNDLKYNPQLEVIDELLALCKKENRTKLENSLVLKEEGATIENDLLDMKGTYYLSEYKLESALETLKQMPRKDRDNYAIANPFRETLTDCVNCKILDTVAYNKVDMLEQIFELEYKAKADEENGAYNYYKIGVALYNISYFGHSWKLADYFRSGSSWNYLKTGKDIFRSAMILNGNKETTNCALSLYYFDKAYRLSNAPELTARSAFMAAKCQQNLYFIENGSEYSPYSNKIPNVPAEYRAYFDILLDHYQDTEFFAEAIEECLYFERYARR